MYLNEMQLTCPFFSYSTLNSILFFSTAYRVPAHRIVLSASSAYFSAMFMGSLRETKEEEITLVDVHGEPLQLLIQYCYTGTIELREDNVEILLATACLLQLTPVVNACCNFLAKQLHPSNCLGFALFAEQQSCHTLFQLSTSYTSQHFMQVCKNQEFYQLSSDQLATLLKSDDLNVPTEKDVFHALMSWVQFDFEAREKHIPELLGLIRLPLLPPAVSSPRLSFHTLFSRSQSFDNQIHTFSVHCRLRGKSMCFK